MRTVPIALVLVLFAGCDVVSRGDVTARRHLAIALPATATPAMPAGNARPVRLRPVTAPLPIGTELLERLPGGELRSHPTWRWATSPGEVLGIYLAQAIAADPGLVRREDPDITALRVSLLDCDINTARRKVLLQVQVERVEPDKTVACRLFTVDQDWNGELPGDLAAKTGQAMAEAAQQVAAFAKGAPVAGLAK